jgi:hypothetical protein
MSGALQLALTLAGIAGLLLLVVAASYGIGWLVGLGFRFVPLAGRRHRK